MYNGWSIREGTICLNKRCWQEVHQVTFDEKVVSCDPDWLSSLVMQMMLILTSTMHGRYMYIVFLNEMH